MFYVEDFFVNIVQGVCFECYGIGRVYVVIEEWMVFDFLFIIWECVIVLWLIVWYGYQLWDVFVVFGYDVDVLWKDLLKKDWDWIFYIDEIFFVFVYF